MHDAIRRQFSSTGNSLPMLSIKRLVDLIKEVEGRRVTFLNGKDQRQCNKRLLTTRQLLHVFHLGLVPRERHLQPTHSSYRLCGWLIASHSSLNGMSDERQNRPILSADKIAQQKSVVCHAKIAQFSRPTKSPDFVGQNRACSIFNDFVGRLFVYRTTNFVYLAMVNVYNGRWIFILVIYCVCYYFRSLDVEKSDASIILQSLVVLADIVRSSRWKYWPCVMVD